MLQKHMNFYEKTQGGKCFCLILVIHFEENSRDVCRLYVHGYDKIL